MEPGPLARRWKAGYGGSLALRALRNTQSRQERDVAEENLWLVKCTDRDGDDVDDLREEHMAGNLANIEAIVDHIAMSGPLKDAAGEKNLWQHAGVSHR